MSVTWTATQKHRLIELDASIELQEKTFLNKSDRDCQFINVERNLTGKNRAKLYDIKTVSRRSLVSGLNSKLIDTLTENDFTEVLTPIIISKHSLQKMSIGEDHELFHKVFWTDENRCLRPMLAPNLYCLLKKLSRVWNKPIRIFEIGPCFRRDSRGKSHLTEFTMLNLVELGLPAEMRLKRLQELVDLVMSTAGIKTYSMIHNQCEVYGKTIDIIAREIEVASGVIGPHPLDVHWGIRDSWVGIGFGIERLALVQGDYQNIGRLGRSLSYIDGIYLSL